MFDLNFLTSVKILSKKKEVSCCSDREKEGVDEKDIKSEISQFNN